MELQERYRDRLTDAVKAPEPHRPIGRLMGQAAQAGDVADLAEPFHGRILLRRAPLLERAARVADDQARRCFSPLLTSCPATGEWVNNIAGMRRDDFGASP